MKKVLVVGGGASGMMAAIAAAESGHDVTLLERNEKLGKKIYITGKGRCNLTTSVATQDFFRGIFVGEKFVYSAVYGFDSVSLLNLLASVGLKTKTERGNRVFPNSDKASDVTKALQKLMGQYNVTVQLNCKVRSLILTSGKVTGVITASGDQIFCDQLILCCGGKSYPSTGSDGNGFQLAQQAGHSISPLSPALVGMRCAEPWIGRLAGLTLKNIRVTLYQNQQAIASEFGEMLFTHDGVSGPTILTLSCKYTAGSDSILSIDLKPALDAGTLEQRLLRDFQSMPNREVQNALDQLLPKSLAKELIILSGIDLHKKINQVTTKERKDMISLLKGTSITVKASGGYNEAIITNGGVMLTEINPSTMQSKLVKGLSFAGEMINVHGITGGYNLQLAFSTGYLAGKSIPE